MAARPAIRVATANEREVSMVPTAPTDEADTTEETAVTTVGPPAALEHEHARGAGGTDRIARLRRAVGRAARGIRARVVLGYVVLLAIALAVAVVATRQVLLARVDREVGSALEQEVEELRRLAGGTDPETGAPFAGAAAVFDTFLARNVPADGEAFFAFVAGEPYASTFGAPADLLEADDLAGRWTGTGEPVRETVDTDAGSARVLAVPVEVAGERRGTFVVAFFLAEARDEVFQAVRVVGLVSLAVLVLASIAAWSAAGRVLRPVRDLTSTARRVSDTSLGERIPVQGDDELAELGRTFNAMLDRLEAAFRGQRDVLDDVAHELRTPITIVRGHLELLGDDPRERSVTIALVTDELDRMGRYVSDLLVLARAERPDFLEVHPIDVRSIVDGLLDRARSLAPRRWVVDAAPDPDTAWTVADAERLTQAGVALLQNAVQHTEADDEIGIGAHVDGGRIRIWVRDTGPGVDPEVRDRLFTRFTRAPGSRRVRPEGTGLGLAIVGAIAQAHGGRAELDESADVGARFVLDLPRVTAWEPAS